MPCPMGLMQARLNLVEGDEALVGEEHWLVAKNQLAPVSLGANGYPDGPLHIFGMDFVIGAIDLAGGFQQGWI
jgi:hypothetical protein